MADTNVSRFRFSISIGEPVFQKGARLYLGLDPGQMSASALEVRPNLSGVVQSLLAEYLARESSCTSENRRVNRCTMESVCGRAWLVCRRSLHALMAQFDVHRNPGKHRERILSRLAFSQDRLPAGAASGSFLLNVRSQGVVRIAPGRVLTLAESGLPAIASVLRASGSQDIPEKGLYLQHLRCLAGPSWPCGRSRPCTATE
jgi:hypothetical protein